MHSFGKDTKADLCTQHNRRHLIMLEDDPGFDILGSLPSLDLLGWDAELAGVPSQGSTNRFSFMTPHGGLSQASLASSQNQPFLSFGPPSSSLGAASYRLPSQFGHHSSPLAKQNRDLEAMPEFQPFGEDELDPISAIGLDFDADGNLIGIIGDEPELPPLPGAGPGQAHPSSRVLDLVGGPEEQLVLEGGDEQVLNMGEAALPDAEAFPVQRAAKKAPNTLGETSETTETEQASAHIRRGRPRKLRPMLDMVDHVPRAEFRDWAENYVQHMDATRKRPRATTQAQAKKNAVALLYGNRIAGIGVLHGNLASVNPLAHEFAGRALKARLLGLRTDEVEYGHQQKRGRRRKSPEVFGQDDAAREAQRNVRPRLDKDAELGRGGGHGDGLALGDDSVPEIGMEAAPPMEDRRSSSVMPWSRPASVARGQGSAQKGVPSPSPLHARGGSVIGSIEHHSDPAETPLGAAMGLGPRDDSSLDFDSSLGALDFHRGDQEAPA